MRKTSLFGQYRTGGFGREFKMVKEIFDGYGMITQKHAHQHGSFYRMPLR